MKIEIQEKEKYVNSWKDGSENNSRCAYPLACHIGHFNKDWKMLDIGCGNGLVVNTLRNQGFNVYGVDITLEGLNLNHPMKKRQYLQEFPDYPTDRKNFYEFPIWETPFKDNEFDFTFSTDVLEHIPPKYIDRSIKEIYRITKIETFHCIATFKDNRGGYIFHLIVEDIEWWKDKFQLLNFDKIKTELIDRKDFLSKLDNL